MNALISPAAEFALDVPSEREDFDVIWGDEEFINELMEAISENFVLEVEGSRMLAQRELKDG
jgi:hypothetical protein